MVQFLPILNKQNIKIYHCIQSHSVIKIPSFDFKFQVTLILKINVIKYRRSNKNGHVDSFLDNVHHSYFEGVQCFQKQINATEYQRGNNKWTIQRNWQHSVHKTTKNKTKIQHNMYWTSLYTNNVNNTCTLLQTTGGKD